MPFEDSPPIEIDTEPITETLGIQRRTVQMSLKQLNELGGLGWESVRAKIWRPTVSQATHSWRSTVRPDDPQFAWAIHSSRVSFETRS
ncbi:MAG: hypothetical protein J7641_19155 [Cyanobacteria bacterium SID2]|nr:hypothetical protein [Cyanobacteria bacterium SID2]MBP0004018.1 hypothetical protein [Cyanobacteria bacterium SBC]